jgi:hypothetical protein
MLVVFFMTTLAEIQDQGHRVHVKTLWRSIDVPKEDVAGIAPSIRGGSGRAAASPIRVSLGRTGTPRE